MGSPLIYGAPRLYRQCLGMEYERPKLVQRIFFRRNVGFSFVEPSSFGLLVVAAPVGLAMRWQSSWRPRLSVVRSMMIRRSHFRDAANHGATICRPVVVVSTSLFEGDNANLQRLRHRRPL